MPRERARKRERKAGRDRWEKDIDREIRRKREYILVATVRYSRARRRTPVSANSLKVTQIVLAS